MCLLVLVVMMVAGTGEVKSVEGTVVIFAFFGLCYETLCI